MSSNRLTMPSFAFFILGLVVETVLANETMIWNGTDSELHNSSSITTTTASIITSNITSITSANTPNIQVNMNDTESTAVPATTKNAGKKDPSISPGNETDVVTPAPGGSSRTTSKPTTTTRSTQTAGSDSTGIIILVVLIIATIVFVAACFLAHKRKRRYSVDFSSRQDEANIPLSNMVPVETAPQNGLTTFASTETTAKEPEEPEAKPEAKAEAQVEQKAETDGSADEPTADSAAPAPAAPPAPAPAPAPAPDSSEGKPKGDAVEPPAPVESTVEDKTDAAVSDKTSVESPKETNKNNSNNADFSQTKNLIFWEEVPLDCPV